MRAAGGVLGVNEGVETSLDIPLGVFKMFNMFALIDAG